MTLLFYEHAHKVQVAQPVEQSPVVRTADAAAAQPGHIRSS